LDLDYIAQKYGGNVQYNPERFPGLVYRLWKPKTAMLIFKTGKMVCVGSKTIKDAKKAIYKVNNDVIKKCFGKQELPLDINIANIVASVHINKTILVDEYERLTDQYPRYKVMYEPDMFPAVVARDSQEYEITKPDGGKIVLKESPTFLLYTTGNIVSAGCRSEESLESRVNDLFTALFNSNLLEAIQN
jgi:transcription initiation factor TFIID TATA-box-binding protein